MAYENLKNAIRQAIKQNSNQEITGDLLQSTLLSMIDETEAGVRVSDIENTEYDLDIADDFGNILVEFKNGHIKTKNFDSERLKNADDYLKDKKLSILGDSTSTFKGYSISGNDEYPVNSSTWNSPVVNISDMWWYKVANHFSMKIDTVNAYGGRRFTYGGDYTSFIDAAKSVGNPDIVIIKGGINEILHTTNNSLGDYNFGRTLDDNAFRQAIQKTLINVMTSAPNARIIMCTPIISNNARFDVKTNGISYYDLIDSITTVCKAYGVECVELHRCGISEKNYSTYLGDGIHPNLLGMNAIAKFIINYLLDTSAPWEKV